MPQSSTMSSDSEGSNNNSNQDHRLRRSFGDGYSFSPANRPRSELEHEARRRSTFSANGLGEVTVDVRPGGDWFGPEEMLALCAMYALLTIDTLVLTFAQLLRIVGEEYERIVVQTDGNLAYEFISQPDFQSVVVGGCRDETYAHLTPLVIPLDDFFDMHFGGHVFCVKVYISDVLYQAIDREQHEERGYDSESYGQSFDLSELADFRVDDDSVSTHHSNSEDTAPVASEIGRLSIGEEASANEIGGKGTNVDESGGNESNTESNTDETSANENNTDEVNANENNTDETKANENNANHTSYHIEDTSEEYSDLEDDFACTQRSPPSKNFD